MECAIRPKGIRGPSEDGASTQQQPSFTFWRIAGQIDGIIAALEIPVTYIRPLTWRRAFNVPKGKDGSRLRASELLPICAECFRRKRDDGRAEAAALKGKLAEISSANANLIPHLLLHQPRPCGSSRRCRRDWDTRPLCHGRSDLVRGDERDGDDGPPHRRCGFSPWRY
jgi:hypothetical protein